MLSTLWLIALLAGAALVAGLLLWARRDRAFASTASVADVAQSCAFGESKSCSCSDGSPGTQTCLDGGNGWNPCKCLIVSDAGSADTGTAGGGGSSDGLVAVLLAQVLQAQARSTPAAERPAP